MLVRCALSLAGLLVVITAAHQSPASSAVAAFPDEPSPSARLVQIAEVQKKAPPPKAAPKPAPRPVAVPKSTPRPVAAPKSTPRPVTAPKAPTRTVAPKPVPKMTTAPKVSPKPTPKVAPKSIAIPKSAPAPKVGPVGTPKTGPKSITKTGPAEPKVGPITKPGPAIGKKPDTKGVTKTGPLTGPGTKKGPIAGPGTKAGPDIKKGPIAGPGPKVGPGPNTGPTKTGPIAGPGKKGPVGPVGPITKAGPKGKAVNVTVINRRNVPIFRGGRTIFVGRDIRRIVAVGTLAAIAVGAVYYYPYGYAAISRPVCYGITDEGCTLRWQNVATEEGDVVAQCVQYCPQGYFAPPPVALVSPPSIPVVPPTPQAGCDIAIYAEANFGGVSSETGEDQPQLGEVGWGGEIASIEIKAGTWDFYSEEQFAGDTIRLGPGPYPVLPGDWTKRIYSFMCTDPAGTQ